jgi:hypothetical protein
MIGQFTCFICARTICFVCLFSLNITRLLVQDYVHCTEYTFTSKVREPPTLTGKFGNWSFDFFNLSFTFRRDSDIDNGWANVVDRNRSDEKKVLKIFHHQNGFVVYDTD